MSETVSAPAGSFGAPHSAPVPFSRFAAWGFGLAFFAPLIGVILSHIGLASIVSGQRRGKALAIWGLALNYLAILLYPFAVALLVWLGWIVLIFLMGAPADAYTGPIGFWLPAFTGRTN